MKAKSNGAREEIADDRREVVEKLRTSIEELAHAIEKADPTTRDEQQLMLKRYHELGYLANQYRKLRRDTDLDEMDERLVLLEQNISDD